MNKWLFTVQIMLNGFFLKNIEVFMIKIHDKVIKNERLILNILVNYKVIKLVFKSNLVSSDTIWFFAKIRINESPLF